MSSPTPCDICVLASTTPPSSWPKAILCPLPGARTSVFGHRHVFLSRDRSVLLPDALVWTGLCDSHNNARKLIRNNGVLVNRVREPQPDRRLGIVDALPNLDAIVLEAGKFRFAIVELLEP